MESNLELNYESQSDITSVFRQQDRNSFSHSEESLSQLDENLELYQYFMNIAILSAKKRKNYRNQAGACIINLQNKIVGIGNYTQLKSYKTGFLSWLIDGQKSKPDYINHAEMNAIVNRIEPNLDNCTLFVTTFPCMECAKMILQSGIKHVIYTEDSCCQGQSEEERATTKMLFKLSGISFIRLD